MDKEQKQYQNPLNNSPLYLTGIPIYHPTYPMQQEHFELKNELLIICQYLRSLTERQEQLWHQINYGHEQIRNECRQYFQILNNILVKKTEPKSAHDHCEKDAIGLIKIDENVAAGLKLPTEDIENFKSQSDNSIIKSDYSVITEDKRSPSELPQKRLRSPISENIKEKDLKKQDLEWQMARNNCSPCSESGMMPKSSSKKQETQSYKETISGHDLRMAKANVWNIPEQKVLPEICKIQGVSAQETQKLNPYVQNGEFMIIWDRNDLKQANNDSAKSHLLFQSLPKANQDNEKDQNKDGTKCLDEQNEKLKQKTNEKKSKPQFFSEKVTEKLENLEKLKEEVRSEDKKLPKKLYTEAVLTEHSSVTNLNKNPSLDLNSPNKFEQHLHVADIPDYEESFKGTGPYADAISKLLTDRVSSPAGSANSSFSSNSLTSFRNKNFEASKKLETTDSANSTSTVPKESFEKPQNKDSFECIPELGAEFQINRSKEFSVSGKNFLTPYLYTRLIACKVRVCICFNMTGHINAFIHVARGVFDDEIKWPVIFSGSGHILHNGSKQFSPIFQFGATVCSKPLSNNSFFVLKTAICLSSPRSSHQYVTYQDLERMQYAGNNCLIFKWNLEVEKK